MNVFNTSPVDVANLAMMMRNRGEPTTAQQPAPVQEHMLAALKEVAETFGEDWREGSTQRRLGDKARTAIAKAGGGA